MWKFFLTVWDWVYPYRMDEQNPCRRWCKHCGQQQDQYSFDYQESMLNGPSWWENMRKVERNCPRFGDHSENGL